MISDNLQCKQCVFGLNCPVQWSRNNAACLTIRKPSDAAILYDVLSDIFSGKELDERYRSMVGDKNDSGLPL